MVAGCRFTRCINSVDIIDCCRGSGLCNIGFGSPHFRDMKLAVLYEARLPVWVIDSLAIQPPDGTLSAPSPLATIRRLGSFVSELPRSDIRQADGRAKEPINAVRAKLCSR